MIQSTSVSIPKLCEVINFDYIEGVELNINSFSINERNLKLNVLSKMGFYGIMLIKEGAIKLSLDTQELVLRKLNILQIFPGSIIAFKEIAEDTNIECILFSNEFFSDLNLEWSSKAALEVLSSNFSKVIPLSEIAVSSIAFNMERIKILNTHNNPNPLFVPQMLKLYFSLIVYEITHFRQIDLDTEKDSLSFRKEDIAIQFVNLVGENFRSHKDVQYYADHLYISRTHLTRTIKDVLLKTPKKIIEDKIISEAKNMLFRSETINHVMSNLNFDDQAAFTKFFKKYTGGTPTAYRKGLLGNS